MPSASARRSRLAKAVAVWNIAKTAIWIHSTNLVPFYPMSAKLGSTLIVKLHWTVSVQKETRPGLGCYCSKTKVIITHRHDHLISLGTFIPRLCFWSELCQWKNIMNMTINQMAFQFWVIIYKKLKSCPSVRHAVNLPGIVDIAISTA